MLDVLGGLPPAAVAFASAGLLHVAATTMRARSAATLTREKRHTLSMLAVCLSRSGGGHVTHRDTSGNQWSITMFPPVDRAGPLEAASQ
jgi:hypothetical protein